MSKLRPTGEEVKAKKEKLLTCVCTRARWPQVVKGREAGCRRRRKTSGVLIENGELSEKRRGTFSIVGRKGVGRCLTKRSTPARAVRSHCVRDAHCGENCNFAIWKILMLWNPRCRVRHRVPKSGTGRFPSLRISVCSVQPPFGV